jgi:cytochrome c nitrite reductase small subunit
MPMKLSFSLLLLILTAAATGFAVYTFFYARGYSYLSNNPEACKNCHVMQEQYNGWVKSSHHQVATCNDCHTPHNLVGKYTTKALNGFWHSYYFTTGSFPEPIRITERNFRITEKACRNCHQDFVHNIEVLSQKGAMNCTHCHRNVGHLEE